MINENVSRKRNSNRRIARLIAILLAFAVAVFALIGCGNVEKDKGKDENKDKGENGKLSIVATIFPPYDFARQIGGEHVEVTMLLAPGTESHTYEPTPKEIVKIAKADLFIYTGGVSDTWVDRLLDAAEIDRAKTVRMMDFVKALEESHEGILDESAEHDHDHHGTTPHDHDGTNSHDHDHDGTDPHDHDRESTVSHARDHTDPHNNKDTEEHDHDGADPHDHDHDGADQPSTQPHRHDHDHGFDEHIWTSPINALKIAEGIASHLIETDKTHADDYRKNLENLRNDLQELDGAFRAIKAETKRPELVVADRFPLIYFTTEYGFSYMAAYPGCAAETEPKPKTVAAMIEKVRSENISYVFHIEFSNEKLADLVSSETGAKKLLFHTAHNVTTEELTSGVTYVSIMRQNVENLRKALIDG